MKPKNVSMLHFEKLPVNIHKVTVAAFLISCIFGGGASRNDVTSQPIIWLTSIICMAASLFVFKHDDLSRIKAPLMFLAFCAILVSAQLIPLPPSIWAVLPGRDAYLVLPEIAGFDPPWRPFSVTPDLTLSSLMSLLPLAAMIMAYTTMSDAFRRFLITGLACLCVASAVLGLAQLSSGNGGMLRFYEVTNRDFAVGLFANRNHQAVLLALGIPLIVVATRLSSNPQVVKFGPWISGAFIMFMLPMILVTGARIGIILAIYVVVVALIISRTKSPAKYTRRRHDMPNRIRRYIVPVAVLAVVVFTFALSRAVAIDRIFSTDAQQELRLVMIAPLMKIFWAFFPVGSGFGSFEPIFRQYEPFELLRPGYMNHAHNDLLQLGIEGGIPALLLAAFLGAWSVIAGLRLWRPQPTELNSKLLTGRFAAAMLPVFLVASIFDYPLRTPLLGVVFVLLLLWVHDGQRNLSRINRRFVKDDAFTI